MKVKIVGGGEKGEAEEVENDRCIYKELLRLDVQVSEISLGGVFLVVLIVRMA